MTKDYRSSKYCGTISDILKKKNQLYELILLEHSKAENMYNFISDNHKPYKEQFRCIYNNKCCYCGVSTKLIDKRLFEIDHFIPKSSFSKESEIDKESAVDKESEADNIENLVLACYDCNRSKGDFLLDNADQDKVHPDFQNIIKAFIRDDNYTIIINPEPLYKNDNSIKEFYYHVGLDKQTHRLDYLLINMIGLRDKFKKTFTEIYSLLNQAIEIIKDLR